MILTDQQSSIAHTFTLTVSSALSFVTQSLNSCFPGVACSNQIVAAGGIPPYTFSVPANTNLGGLTLSASGLLSGTPTSAGSINVPVILTDQQGSLTHTFIQPVIANLVVTTGSLPGGTVGVNYGATLLAAGGQQPYTWSVAGGSLPPGLSLDSLSGNIYGTPSTAGSFSFSVQAADGPQTSPSQPLSIAIAAAPVIPPITITSPAQLTAGVSGIAYSQPLTATGGNSQYTWTVTAGALPAGLSLASNGTIAGTPTTAQTATFTATVNDTAGDPAASAGFTIIVAGPTTVSLVTPNPLPNGAVGVNYNYAIQVVGGTPPYFYSISAGQVPPGLTFNETNGTLNGTPTVKGSFGIVLNVSDSGTAPVGVQSVGVQSDGVQAGSPAPKSARASTSSNYTIQIAGPGDFQITTPQNLPNATLGVSYSTIFAASGGNAPYQWKLVDGTLPTGLTLSSAGAITGSPTQSGLASLVVQATDSKGNVATGSFLLQIINPNVPAVTPFPPLPPGIVGQAYQAGFTGVGGHIPYTWSVYSGTLPPGVTLNPQTGALSGPPAQVGNYPFTVEVTDSRQATGAQAFSIVVNALTLQITPTQIPVGITNVPYSLALNVTGGTAPYNWSLSAGGLLTGFTINPATGAIAGTPTVAGSYTFTISVIDSNFGLALETYQLTVQAPNVSLSVATTSVPAGTVGASYDYGLTAANSTPPLNWTVYSGTLPPGIQLMSASGALVGTPTTAGSYPFTAQVTDSTTATAQASFTLLVNPAPLTIVTTSLPGGAVATAYSQTVTSSGGTGAIAWSVSKGTLPAGLALAGTTGTISGTPTAIASYSFTLEATDSKGVTAQQAFTVSIAGPPPAPAITLSGLPATSQPGNQPVVTITLASPYPLPIVVTASLSIAPNPGNTTDLMFANGTRTTQLTIPAGATTATVAFQTGTLPGTIQFSLGLSAAGVSITPAAPPEASTVIAATAPVISSVAVTSTATGLQVTVNGTSTTLDMKSATFTFTPAAGATLQTSTVTVDVSTLFAAWYASSASLATGSQFSLTVPFTITGNVSTIASVSVTLTNSVGTSAAVSANVP